MIIRLILLFLLIFINGILSSSEIAYLSLDRYSLARKKDKKSKKIYKMLQDESKFLSTIQIGITLAGFLASAFASDSFTDILMEKGLLFINESFTENFLMIVITLILSYVTLVFGELVPKKIGRSKPLKVARLTVDGIVFISVLFRPLIALLTFSTEFICKILKIKEHNDSLSESDIKKMIITGNREGIVEEKEKEYILNIFKFNDISAGKIMTPVQDVVTIRINDSKQEVVEKIRKAKFTRYPVINEDGTTVLGFINIRDFIYLHKNEEDFKLRNLIHPALTFKKSEKIDDIFRIMQEKHENISIIVDGNKFVGILTLEDAIEEIVGNIADEYN